MAETKIDGIVAAAKSLLNDIEAMDRDRLGETFGPFESWDHDGDFVIIEWANLAVSSYNLRKALEE